MADWISNLAHKYYGEKPAVAMTLEEWEAYDERILTQHGKVGFFLLRRVQRKWDDFIWKIRPIWDVDQLFYRATRGIRRKLYNRNVINTGIKDWCDYDGIMEAAIFQCLVEFVEVELASMQLFGFSNRYKDYGYTWFCRYRLKELRCPQAGLDHLDWEINECEHPPQAESAKIKKELYLWWTKGRKERPDAFELSGLKAFYSDEGEKVSLRDRSKKKKEDPEYAKAYKEAQERWTALEKQYQEEDEARLIQLVKIRGHLWT